MKEDKEKGARQMKYSSKCYKELSNANGECNNGGTSWGHLPILPWYRQYEML